MAILAVLKAGGAYVPLDPEYPPERLAFVLDDTEAPVLVTQERLLDRLSASDAATRLPRPGRRSASRASRADDLDRSDRPAGLAYVIYTSGSTGQAEGRAWSSTATSRACSAATDAWFGFGADDIWLLFHSYAFDFSVWELWGALLLRRPARRRAALDDAARREHSPSCSPTSA